MQLLAARLRPDGRGGDLGIVARVVQLEADQAREREPVGPLRWRTWPALEEVKQLLVLIFGEGKDLCGRRGLPAERVAMVDV